MKLIQPDWQAPSHVHAFMTTRTGGVSEGVYGPQGLNPALHVGDDDALVLRNRAMIRALVPSEPLWLNQTHSTDVWTAQQPSSAADAVVLTQAGQVGAIMTADCLPVIFSAADGKVIGAAHAGWRGLVNGVLDKTVHMMQDKGAQVSDIHAWLGAAIGPLQFEVGQDVLDVFMTQSPTDVRPYFAAIGHGKYWADIYGLARARLTALGLSRISGGSHCTVSEAETFYSYRRDQVTGRMATLIWMDAV